MDSTSEPHQSAQMEVGSPYPIAPRTSEATKATPATPTAAARKTISGSSARVTSIFHQRSNPATASASAVFAAAQVALAAHPSAVSRAPAVRLMAATATSAQAHMLVGIRRSSPTRMPAGRKSAGNPPAGAVVCDAA